MKLSYPKRTTRRATPCHHPDPSRRLPPSAVHRPSTAQDHVKPDAAKPTPPDNAVQDANASQQETHENAKLQRNDVTVTSASRALSHNVNSALSADVTVTSAKPAQRNATRSDVTTVSKPSQRNVNNATSLRLDITTAKLLQGSSTNKLPGAPKPQGVPKILGASKAHYHLRATRSLSGKLHSHHRRVQFGLGNFVSPSCIYPKPGDLIEFDRKLYSHWAVYVGGENHQVIHVAGDNGREIASEHVRVRQASLQEVAGESLVRINNKTVPAKERKLRALDARRVVAHARRCLGREVTYDMIGCNAEHYVTLWRYGKAWSDQAETAVAVMTPYKKKASNHYPTAAPPPEVKEELKHKVSRPVSTTSCSSVQSCSSLSPEEESDSGGGSGSPGTPTGNHVTPVSPTVTDQSPGLLSDKDVSFQMSLRRGLSAIFETDRPSDRRASWRRSLDNAVTTEDATITCSDVIAPSCVPCVEREK